MGKIVLTIISTFYLSAHAIVPENIFFNDYLFSEQILYKYFIKKSFDSFGENKKQKFIKGLLQDPDKIIDPRFKIPKGFYSSTTFWFKVYTIYNSKNAIIHDRENLNIVYDVLNFKQLYDSSLNQHSKVHLQSKYSLQHIHILKKHLTKLIDNPFLKTAITSKIFKILKQARVKIPKKKERRKIFFNNLKKNIRIQTGQRDMIFQGLLNSRPFTEFLNKYFKIFDLPPDLLAIAFLESSFNPHAYSKVAAAGVWQFMPRIGAAMMPMNDNIDGRINPIISGLSAMHLLKQNIRILKRWDLAVTAYNSGTMHIVRARRKLKNKKMTLYQMFKYYKNPHIGFASRNFYPSFLALVYALNYQKNIYSIKGAHTNLSSSLNSRQIDIYISICPFTPEKIITELKNASPQLAMLNTHFKNNKLNYPRGTLFVSDVHLTAKKFWKILPQNTRKKFPKNWHKLIRDQPCKNI